jgi:hypothetical protein
LGEEREPGLEIDRGYEGSHTHQGFEPSAEVPIG